AVRDGVVLPPEHAGDELALLVSRELRLDDLSGRDRAHHLAERDLRDVGVDLHPAALRGVAREPEHAHEHLAVADGGHGVLTQFEVRAIDHALRAGGQQPAAVLHRESSGGTVVYAPPIRRNEARVTPPTSARSS